MKESWSANRLERWFFESGNPLENVRRLVGLGALDKALFLSRLRQNETRPLLLVLVNHQEGRNIVDNLGFFSGKEARRRTHYIPHVDFDFYRGCLPNPEVLCSRNVALFHALNDAENRIFVTSLSTLLQKVMCPEKFLKATQILSPNQEVERESFIHQLLECGYQHQPAAYDPGVFAVRGAVVDVFSPIYDKPIRLEFFGDLIEEIRFFDPETQRSLDKLDRAFLIPVGMSLRPKDADFLAAASAIKDRLDLLGVAKADREKILESIQEGSLPLEFSFLFPYLSGGSGSILDYFPQSTLLFFDDEAKLRTEAREKEFPHLEKTVELFEKALHPIATREELVLSASQLDEILSKSNRYFFEDFSSGDNELVLEGQPLTFTSERQQTTTVFLEKVARRFKDWMDLGFHIHIVCHTQTHAEKIQHLFGPHGIKSHAHPEDRPAIEHLLKSEFDRLNLWNGYISESRLFPMLQQIILSEEEIFGAKKRVSKSSSWSTSPSRLLSSFKDLKVNDFIVHRDHGIGRYLGLKTMNFLESENDYVLLEYQGGDKLYIPIYRLNVLQKYGGGDTSVALDRLGVDRWAKVKAKARRAIAELAAEFLNMQAKRKLIPAPQLNPPPQEYEEFELEFPYDETPDQQKAIEMVQTDLSQTYAMDRLICGDVGYGKTEVAMRACFRCAYEGYQVAVLVPTTILALQHFENFKKRFSRTAIRVEMVSRLRSTVDIKQVLEKTRAGHVDIIIGTHRLLSSDIAFNKLGLIVLDEEHRFGVVHKERLKKMCDSVHVLSMTATPIPRTLNMAMTGIKEISIITTPPPDRLSVRTFVSRYSPEVITEAIKNELARDGQVFFVHNRIESIFGIADELKNLFPKLHIEVVHGQMDSAELEKKMLAFYQGHVQVLLTTTIIESGLDIPRANTILINDAQNFGLAQLYQLRGRVGRSEKRAYCYLLIPNEQTLSNDGKSRLQIIQRYSELGSGFNIASHDLEIRGAGDLLGKEQSGHLNAVGVDLYFELLEESLQELRGEQKKIEIEPEINMKISAAFPEKYLPDISERVQLYRRLSGVESEETISEIEAEIRDRFGPLPEEVTNLLGLMQLKLFLKRLHVIRMSCGPKRTALQFASTTPLNPEVIVKLIQKDPKRYSLTPDQKLVYTVDQIDWKSQLREVRELWEKLVG